jgi:hypothetical protein
MLTLAKLSPGWAKRASAKPGSMIAAKITQSTHLHSKLNRDSEKELVKPPKKALYAGCISDKS